MITRIKKAEFKFPDPEWGGVSHEAKRLITGMLQTNPQKRYTIRDIVNSDWISVKYFNKRLIWLYIIIGYLILITKKVYENVPKTPLAVSMSKFNWNEIHQNMEKALDDMRISSDNKNLLIKNVGLNSHLFERRMKKARLEHEHGQEKETTKPVALAIANAIEKNEQDASNNVLSKTHKNSVIKRIFRKKSNMK
jgi:serine/threonine protein kinase